jgi:hypothetical protein
MDQKSKHHLRPWLAWTMIIVAAAGVGFMAWWSINIIDNNPVSQPIASKEKVLDTAGWKTYENKDLGFSFNYQSGDILYVNDQSFWQQETNLDKVLSLVYFKKADYGKKFGLGSDLDQIKNKQDIADAIKSNQKLNVPGLTSDKVTLTKYGTNNFLVIFPGSTEGCFCSPIEFVTTVGDYYVMISKYNNDTKGKIDVTDFTNDHSSLIQKLYGNIEEAISTFQFITPVSIADWKTYENKDFGFSFKYPKDWADPSENITTEKTDYSLLKKSSIINLFTSIDPYRFNLNLIVSQYDEINPFERVGYEGLENKINHAIEKKAISGSKDGLYSGLIPSLIGENYETKYEIKNINGKNSRIHYEFFKPGAAYLKIAELYSDDNSFIKLKGTTELPTFPSKEFTDNPFIVKTTDDVNLDKMYMTYDAILSTFKFTK